MKYPNKLRDIRKRTSSNANDLAELLGVTFQHYYALERGERQLSAQQLAKLARFLNSTADEIISYTPLETDEIKNEKPQNNSVPGQEIVDAYFRIMESAKKQGIPPEDFEMALEFVTKFKNKGK
jgi:transcriptional regulator with XRE-family HTH domain